MTERERDFQSISILTDNLGESFQKPFKKTCIMEWRHSAWLFYITSYMNAKNIWSSPMQK